MNSDELLDLQVIDTMVLSEEGTKKLLSAIDNPPEPNEKLINAAKRYRKHGCFYVKL